MPFARAGGAVIANKCCAVELRLGDVMHSIALHSNMIAIESKVASGCLTAYQCGAHYGGYLDSSVHLHVVTHLAQDTLPIAALLILLGSSTL